MAFSLTLFVFWLWLSFVIPMTASPASNSRFQFGQLNSFSNLLAWLLDICIQLWVSWYRLPGFPSFTFGLTLRFGLLTSIACFDSWHLVYFGSRGIFKWFFSDADFRFYHNSRFYTLSIDLLTLARDWFISRFFFFSAQAMRRPVSL